jgi:hypothetical protein
VAWKDHTKSLECRTRRAREIEQARGVESWSGVDMEFGCARRHKDGQKDGEVDGDKEGQLVVDALRRLSFQN